VGNGDFRHLQGAVDRLARKLFLLTLCDEFAI
jgi:hypothetical protein